MPTPPLSDDVLIQTLETLAANGGKTGPCAEALGISRNALYNRLARAAQRGLDGSVPRPVPHGQAIKGVSTLYDRNGRIAAQWVKTRAEALPLDDVIEALQTALAEHQGRAPVTPPPVAAADTDLLNLFLLPDLHLGMRAWAAETGADYDLSIAERLSRAAFSDLVARAPAAGHAVILGLGDLTHADDETATTRRSGNRLDVDTRHQKVLVASLKLLLWKIDLCLSRFPRVTVRILKGNHDEQTAAAVSVALSLFYDGHDRVTVDASPSLWWYLRHGRVLLGATHGHTIKAENMAGVMAAERAEDWGATRWRYVHHGHLHHRRVIEVMGVPVECFQTPAPKDAYHAGAGYVSGRSLTAITYHAEHGEYGRVTVGIAPLETELKGAA
ncbi:MAG: helix-turn-helix domain-containing protein [Paracoccus sp. (in: a-proteobacteria)]|nr:helix-turn-helix domain-containing protein [Paracoccus sp. (in: a-proteobacteria)]